jgi:hypothetical protein
MTYTTRVDSIRTIYDKWQSSGNSSATRPAREPMSPVMIVDRVTLSQQALQKQTGQRNGNELNEEQKQQVEKLKKRDADVKTHEQAHMASGGGLVQGGASFEYESGPDGRMYAVGGEVKIDVSPERTPEATIRKMQQVRRAALAPAEPSGADRAVAAQASQVEAQARMELSPKNKDGIPAGDGSDASPLGAAEPTHSSSPEGAASFRSTRGRRIDLVT